MARTGSKKGNPGTSAVFYVNSTSKCLTLHCSIVWPTNNDSRDRAAGGVGGGATQSGCTFHQRQRPCWSRGTDSDTLVTRARKTPCAHLLNHLVSTPIECRVTCMMRYSSSHDHNCRTQRRWFDVPVSRWYKRQVSSSSGSSGTIGTMGIATTTSTSTSITPVPSRAQVIVRESRRGKKVAGENDRSLLLLTAPTYMCLFSQA